MSINEPRAYLGERLTDGPRVNAKVLHTILPQLGP